MLRPGTRGGVRSRRQARVHGDAPEGRAGAFAAVYGIVRAIPRGRVMTYGQIASLIEQRLSPRAVGWALHGCPAGVPWHRVVNATGGCSTERLPDTPPGLQQALLEAEGIAFGADHTLSLEQYRFTPRPRGGGGTAGRKATTRR